MIVPIGTIRFEVTDKVTAVNAIANATARSWRQPQTKPAAAATRRERPARKVGSTTETTSGTCGYEWSAARWTGHTRTRAYRARTSTAVRSRGASGAPAATLSSLVTGGAIAPRTSARTPTASATVAASAVHAAHDGRRRPVSTSATITMTPR